MSQILIHTQVEVDEKQLEKILAMVDEEASPAEKVGGLAQTALVALADGGMMLDPLTMRAMEQSIGQPIEGQDQLLALVEEGAGQAGGKLTLRWSVDPVYLPTMQNMADFQGRTVQEIAQNCLDTAVDSGWLIGEVLPNPERVLMSKEDKAALVAVLGSDFTDGTQLAELLKQNLGMTSPFDEVPQIAAAE